MASFQWNSCFLRSRQWIVFWFVVSLSGQSNGRSALRCVFNSLWKRESTSRTSTRMPLLEVSFSLFCVPIAWKNSNLVHFWLCAFVCMTNLAISAKRFFLCIASNPSALNIGFGGFPLHLLYRLVNVSLRAFALICFCGINFALFYLKPLCCCIV